MVVMEMILILLGILFYLNLVGYTFKVNIGLKDSDHKFYFRVGNFRRQVKKLYKSIKNYYAKI